MAPHVVCFSCNSAQMLENSTWTASFSHDISPVRALASDSILNIDKESKFYSFLIIENSPHHRTAGFLRSNFVNHGYTVETLRRATYAMVCYCLYCRFAYRDRQSIPDQR